jgi:purine-cytosine permease-like protein
LVLGIALYVASQIGQRLGTEQMIQLRAALEELI